MADKSHTPKKDSELTHSQLALKNQWDNEWKTDSDLRSAEFYGKKRKGLTTAEEQKDFIAQDILLWGIEEKKRIDAGLYKMRNATELTRQRQSALDTIAEIDALLLEL